MAASRAVPSTSSTPCTNPSLKWSRSSGVSSSAWREAYSWATRRNPPVPAAGSITVSWAVGCRASTIAWISGRGVKY